MLLKIFLPCLLFFHALCAAAAEPSPQEWLNVRGTELLKVLSEKNSKQRFAKTLRLADNVFNSKELSRLALGRYWIEFSDAQKKRYSDLFMKYFIVTYTASPLPLDTVSFKIGDAIPSGRDVLVKTTVNWSGEISELQKDIKKTEAQKNTNAAGIDLIFALRKTAEGYYIRDFQLEGKSVLLFLRGKIEHAYRTSNYSPDDMISAMQEKIQTTAANAEVIDKMKEGRQKAAASRK